MTTLALHIEADTAHAGTPPPPARKAIARGRLPIRGRRADAQAGETMDVTDPTVRAKLG